MAIDFKKMAGMTGLDQLLSYPEFRQQYVWLYDKCHKGQSYYIGGEAHYEAEIGYLKKIWMDTPQVKAATIMSIGLAMIDLAYHGLSIQPISKPTGYLLPRPKNMKKKKNDPDVWENRVIFQISAYGELELRRRSGIIKYADNPVIVHEGDLFEVTENGVKWAARRASQVIIAAFIKITRPDNSVEYKVFSIEDIMTFKSKAKEEQQKSMAWTGGVNGQPMRGMIEAKVIKHAFNTYPRLNLGGSGASLLTDEIDIVEKDSALATVMAGVPEATDDDDNNYTDTENNYSEEAEVTDDQPTAQPVKAETKKETTSTASVPGFNF